MFSIAETPSDHYDTAMVQTTQDVEAMKKIAGIAQDLRCKAAEMWLLAFGWDDQDALDEAERVFHAVQPAEVPACRCGAAGVITRATDRLAIRWLCSSLLLDGGNPVDHEEQVMTTPISDSPNQSRGSIRCDLLIVVAILAAMALCGCEKEPPPLGSNEQCEADAHRQTCYLRAIWRRLDSLPLCVGVPRPPSPPAKAPDDCPYVGQNGGRN